jgi:hypothetical protein
MPHHVQKSTAPARRATPKPSARKRTTPREEAFVASEVQAIIAHDLAALEGIRDRIRRIADLPDRPGAAAMDAGKRPYSLEQWVISEARASMDSNKLEEDIRVLGDVPQATQAMLDAAFQRNPSSYPTLPLRRRRRSAAKLSDDEIRAELVRVVALLKLARKVALPLWPPRAKDRSLRSAIANVAACMQLLEIDVREFDAMLAGAEALRG